MVLPGSLQEEDEGTVTQVEGRIVRINKPSTVRAMPARTGSFQDIAKAPGRERGFHLRKPR